MFDHRLIHFFGKVPITSKIIRCCWSNKSASIV